MGPHLEVLWISFTYNDTARDEDDLGNFHSVCQRSAYVGHTGCSVNVVFFHYPLLQPMPRLHIAAGDFENSQHNAKVLSTPIGWPISVQPMAPQCLRGRGGKIMNIFGEKNNNFSCI